MTRDRSRTERADVLTEIELLVENDLRIQAGSIWVNEIDHETYQLTATVNTGEPITLNLELHNERA
ncbi:DUF2590 family protein [Shewanella sp. MTB7]|uniref:DUF2590 family protein n=1 Tax=Shewanella sp. MTB7 TaxID=2746932 RepID=UPI0022BA2EC2|nr:DUF2590 family protein [Shewanella sp. MTB7]